MQFNFKALDNLEVDRWARMRKWSVASECGWCAGRSAFCTLHRDKSIIGHIDINMVMMTVTILTINSELTWHVFQAQQLFAFFSLFFSH